MVHEQRRSSWPCPRTCAASWSTASTELQQATFASPKRKSIQAYQDFAAAGGEIYVPTPEEKAGVRATRSQPVYDWFTQNVDGGDEVLTALREAVSRAEEAVDAQYQAELN